eukprot:3928273-Prymnesium_polylepis.2
MSDQAQSVIGRALLNNPESRVAFLSGFSESYDIMRGNDTHTFVDHVRPRNCSNLRCVHALPHASLCRWPYASS